MPNRPSRPCRFQPCRFMRPCPRPEHAEVVRDTRSAAARGYGAEHRALRRQVLAEEPYCVGYPAGVHGGRLVRTTHMDHVKSQRRGGRTTRSNTRGLCGSCNARKAVKEEGARPRARAS